MEKNKPKFEEALKELEGIIEELEGGELTLDESLERYERGVKALTACRKILGEAEKKIQLLLRTAEGELKTELFEAEEVVEETEEEKDEDGKIPF